MRNYFIALVLLGVASCDAKIEPRESCNIQVNTADLNKYEKLLDSTDIQGVTTQKQNKRVWEETGGIGGFLIFYRTKNETSPLFVGKIWRERNPSINGTSLITISVLKESKEPELKQAILKEVFAKIKTINPNAVCDLN